MQMWEYEASEFVETYTRAVVYYLNGMGNEGWEVIGLERLNANRVVFYFKRPKPTSPEQLS